MVCPEFRWAFEGVERADSLVVNAHKWMLTPMDCSLLWTRRPDDFRRAFSLIPEYLRTPDAEDALSLSEYGPALGAGSGRSSYGRSCGVMGARGCRSTFGAGLPGGGVRIMGARGGRVGGVCAAGVLGRVLPRSGFR